MHLESIQNPDDLRSLTEEELSALAEEIRSEIVAVIDRTGGHIGSNLGVVELTIALHRVFDSPNDTILWDTGHQCYCLLYTSPSPRDKRHSRMPSSA